jgi:hypothetical protein
MPANDNHLETPRFGRRFFLSLHARERMATRGLRADAVDAALAYGRIACVRGAEIYAIGRKEVARYAKEGVDLAAYDGVQVVVTVDGTILTVYRNRSFTGLRDRRSRRHHRSAVAA